MANLVYLNTVLNSASHHDPTNVKPAVQLMFKRLLK